MVISIGQLSLPTSSKTVIVTSSAISAHTNVRSGRLVVPWVLWQSVGRVSNFLRSIHSVKHFLYFDFCCWTGDIPEMTISIKVTSYYISLQCWLEVGKLATEAWGQNMLCRVHLVLTMPHNLISWCSMSAICCCPRWIGHCVLPVSWYLAFGAFTFVLCVPREVNFFLWEYCFLQKGFVHLTFMQQPYHRCCVLQ